MKQKLLLKMQSVLVRLMMSLFCLVTLAEQTAFSQNYKWGNVEIIAGGFVTGIIYHPTEQGLGYLRTDMGGAYRLNGTTRRWEPITDLHPASEWNMLGIESIALDPADPDRVYMACGTYAYNNWSGNGAILRSTDRGTTWQRTNLSFKLGANEDGRGMGERLALDPNSPNILYLGTRQNGLWKSTDRGASWSQVTSFPAVTTPKDVGLSFVLIDPRSGSAGNASQTIYVGVANKDITNLYRSTDGGASWQGVPNAPTGLMPYQAELASNGTMYFTFNDGPGPNGISTGGVYKLNTGTGAWTRILIPDGQGGFGGLTVDANNPDIVMVGSICRWWPHDQIYRTTNGGTSWKAVGTGTNITRSAAESPYLRWGGTDADLTTGNWVSALAIDPFNSDRVMYATGATIWGCDNIKNADNNTTVNWVIRAHGVEQTAVLSLTSPNAGPSLLSGLGDVCGFVHNDIRKSPSPGMIDPGYKNGESVDFAELNPSTFVIIGHDYTPNYMGSISTDAGVTWTRFTNLPASMQDGMVAINATGTTIIWAPKNQAPYRSTNGGQAWTQTNGIGGSATLVSDRVNANKFYAIRSNILYRSTDGGATFTAGATSGFSGTKLKAVPGREDHVWVPASNGLYRTINGGSSFTKNSLVQRADVVGFGKAAPGQTYPAIFITGSVNNVYGIYRSDDEGATWTRINDDLHQFGAVNTAITGDPRVYGRVYVATNGRGIVLGEIETGPTVSITSPENNASFSGPATITITADASFSSGSVTKVDFYNGATLLGTDAVSPYSFTWNNVANGSYTLTAVVTDNLGQTATSSPVTVTVADPGQIDCNGELNGTAVLDACGTCTGGSTGKKACSTTLGEGYYTIKAVHSGLCLEAGTPVRQQTCTNTNIQVWQLTKNGGHYEMYAIESKTYLGTAGTTAGDNVVASASPLSYRLEDAGNGSFNIIPAAATDLYVDVSGNSLAAGGELLLWTATGGQNQNFIFTPVTVTSSVSPAALAGFRYNPNPFNNTLQLETREAAYYKILDIAGQVVEEGNCEGNCSVGSSLLPGSYIIQMEIEGRKQNAKVIKF